MELIFVLLIVQEIMEEIMNILILVIFVPMIVNLSKMVFVNYVIQNGVLILIMIIMI